MDRREGVRGRSRDRESEGQAFSQARKRQTDRRTGKDRRASEQERWDAQQRDGEKTKRCRQRWSQQPSGPRREGGRAHGQKPRPSDEGQRDTKSVNCFFSGGHWVILGGAGTRL